MSQINEINITTLELEKIRVSIFETFPKTGYIIFLRLTALITGDGLERCTKTYLCGPLSRGGHFVPEDLKSFVYGRLVSFSLRGYPCINKAF